MLDQAVLEDFLNLFAREQLGSGMSRKVFTLHLNDDYVVKIEEGRAFQNVMESHFWDTVRDTKEARWFAPVHSISPNGRVLVMRRTQPLRREDAPTMMPAFFTDFKYSNYGILDGRVVCHDYGTCLLATTGITSRMRKAEWWED